jgi:hypothetical protein
MSGGKPEAPDAALGETKHPAFDQVDRCCLARGINGLSQIGETALDHSYKLPVRSNNSLGSILSRLPIFSRVSKDGALMRRPVRVRRSTEISNTSANLSWAIPFWRRIPSIRRPNFWRNVGTKATVTPKSAVVSFPVPPNEITGPFGRNARRAISAWRNCGFLWAQGKQLDINYCCRWTQKGHSSLPRPQSERSDSRGRT